MRTARTLLAAACAAAWFGGLAAASVVHAQAQLYKWVDEKGVTHWSDRPREGASKVDVPAAQGYRPAPAARVSGSPSSSPASDGAAGVAYSRVAIARPSPDESFVNVGGAIDVAASLDPALAPGHRTWFVLDGRRLEDVAPEATSTSIVAERGSHTIAVEIADESGNVVASSAPVTFHVRQTSIANPPVGPALRPAQGQPTPRNRPRP